MNEIIKNEKNNLKINEKIKSFGKLQQIRESFRNKTNKNKNNNNIIINNNNNNNNSNNNNNNLFYDKIDNNNLQQNKTQKIYLQQQQQNLKFLKNIKLSPIQQQQQQQKQQQQQQNYFTFNQKKNCLQETNNFQQHAQQSSSLNQRLSLNNEQINYFQKQQQQQQNETITQSNTKEGSGVIIKPHQQLQRQIIIPQQKQLEEETQQQQTQFYQLHQRQINNFNFEDKQQQQYQPTNHQYQSSSNLRQIKQPTKSSSVSLYSTNQSTNNQPYSINYNKPTNTNQSTNTKQLNNNNFNRLSYGRCSQRIKPTFNKTSPLVQALRSSDHPLLLQLLHRGEDPNSVDENQVSILFLSLENGGKPKFVKSLLEAGADPNLRHPQTSKTPLHVASRLGFQMIVQMFLSSQADPNLQDLRGETPLMSSIRFNHNSVTKLLVTYYADVSIKNNKQETALLLAIEKQNSALVKILLEVKEDGWEKANSFGISPLLWAAKKGTEEIFILIFQSMEDFSDIDVAEGEFERTALHWAVEGNEIQEVGMLLSKRANVGLRDTNGQTPFLSAVKSGCSVDLIKMLVESSSDPEAVDKFSNTALHYAASEGRGDLIPFLIHLGLDPNAEGSGGLTPLMISSFRNNPFTTEQLLIHGALPNLLDANQASALIFSIFGNENSTPSSPSTSENKNNYQMTKTVLALFKFGVDLDRPVNLFNLMSCYEKKMAVSKSKVPEVQLFSPLEVSFLKGIPQIFHLLLQAGCRTWGFKAHHLELEESCQASSFINMANLVKASNSQVVTLKQICRKVILRNPQLVSKKSKYWEDFTCELLKPITLTLPPEPQTPFNGLLRKKSNSRTSLSSSKPDLRNTQRNSSYRSTVYELSSKNATPSDENGRNFVRTFSSRRINTSTSSLHKTSYFDSFKTPPVRSEVQTPFGRYSMRSKSGSRISKKDSDSPSFSTPTNTRTPQKIKLFQTSSVPASSSEKKTKKLNLIQNFVLREK